MQTTMLHRQTAKQIAKVPACMSAYWSQFSIGSDLGNNGRTPEITLGFREGDGYC